MAMEQHMAQRIVMRLIDNAMEAVREMASPKVTVSTVSADGNARIVVSDSGGGVAGESRGLIFDARFTTKDGHVGMGLTTARDLAGRCGAKLDYEHGTGFVLTAPLLTD